MNYKKRTNIRKSSKKWKYKNNEAAIEYINKHKNHLNYENEDKKILVFCCFLDG